MVLTFTCNSRSHLPIAINDVYPCIPDCQAGQGVLCRPSIADSPCPKELTRQTAGEDRQYTNET